MVAELALALLLVCGAGLLLKSFWKLQAVDPGFQSHGVLKAEYNLPAARYPVDFRRWPDFREQHAFNRALLAAAERLPGVEAAAIAGNHPLDPGFTNSFSIVGREAESRTWPEISIRRVTSGYFRTVGLSLVRGRLIQDSDTTTGAPIVLINETAAERFFGKTDPLGHQMRFWGASRTIVGIVANERFHGLVEVRADRRLCPAGADTVSQRRRRAPGARLRRTRRAWLEPFARRFVRLIPGLRSSASNRST